MPIINLCSPKGGSGTTTIAANLAVSLSRKGKKVLAIDFDPQNSLKLHFGISTTEEKGFVKSILNDNYWVEDLFIIKDNLYFLPYGEVSFNDNLAFWSKINTDANFFNLNYERIEDDPEIFIITDFKSDSYHAHKKVTKKHDVLINVLQTDAASAALLASIHKKKFSDNFFSEKSFFILNQFEHDSGLSRHVKNIFINAFNEKIIGVINYDYKIVEAHAALRNIYDYCPESPAILAMEVIANRILAFVEEKVE